MRDVGSNFAQALTLWARRAAGEIAAPRIFVLPDVLGDDAGFIYQIYGFGLLRELELQKGRVSSDRGNPARDQKQREDPGDPSASSESCALAIWPIVSW